MARKNKGKGPKKERPLPKKKYPPLSKDVKHNLIEGLKDLKRYMKPTAVNRLTSKLQNQLLNWFLSMPRRTIKFLLPKIPKEVDTERYAGYDK
jgi:hypothetical protein